MKHRTKNGALRITSINRIVFLRLPIQNHSKLSITNLWWNKAKTSNWNFRKHEFWREKIVKTCRKTEYIISYILSRIESIKITSNSIRGGVQKKTIYRGELPKKGGPGQFSDLTRAWWKRGGAVFGGEGVGGGDTPMHTMNTIQRRK